MICMIEAQIVESGAPRRGFGVDSLLDLTVFDKVIVASLPWLWCFDSLSYFRFLACSEQSTSERFIDDQNGCTLLLANRQAK